MINIFSDKSKSPLDIDMMGFSGDISITKFGPGKRDSYIIHYVTKGKGYYNGKAVTEGQGFLIYPGQKHEYHSDTESHWEFLWIISNDERMKDVFERYNVNDDLIFNYSCYTSMKKLVNDLFTRHAEIIDSFEMLEIFLRIFNSHAHKKVSVQHTPNSKIYMNFCIDYIENNIHKKITVNELSRLVGVSQPYLHKMFSNEFNISTKEYITLHKINRAKKLLVETDMSITEIASFVGYSDVLVFSKVFFSKEKISPQKYRQREKDNV